MRIGVSGSLLVLLACSPGPGIPDGGAGGGAGGGSGGGTGGACAGAPLTPPNLVANPGFECGDDGWSPQSGTLEAMDGGRSGTKAARLTATAAGAGQFAFTKPVVTSTANTTYCATAWVQGTAANVRLSLLTNKAGAGTDNNFSSPVATGSWIRVPPSITVTAPVTPGTAVYVRLTLTGSSAGQTLLVDDVDVWESTNGSCAER